jgi:hypothetical protein
MVILTTYKANQKSCKAGCKVELLSVLLSPVSVTFTSVVLTCATLAAIAATFAAVAVLTAFTYLFAVKERQGEGRDRTFRRF